MRQLLSASRWLRLFITSPHGQGWRYLALVGLALLLIAPAASAGESVIRVSANTPVRSLDPAKFSLGALEYNYALLVYSRLAYFDDELNVIPDLAERWEASEDQKVWTFHLRRGVTFHDGRELDAEDVLATYKRVADPATGSRQIHRQIYADDPLCFMARDHRLMAGIDRAAQRGRDIVD